MTRVHQTKLNQYVFGKWSLYPVLNAHTIYYGSAPMQLCIRYIIIIKCYPARMVQCTV